jgi:DTW domain-containing protein YfiP
MCARCRRPQVVCYCAALPRIDTATRVVILQHPRERDMPIGTARMASLCLPNARLHVGMRWDQHSALARELADPARPPILLYPGADARDILREPPAGPVTLVVVDGTWSQAKTLVRDNPLLQTLPRYAFATPEPSHYRIRKEPRDEYCSTIEALMHALGALEGEPDRFRALLDPFHAMVDAQLACQAARPQRRTRVPRVVPTARERLPAALRDRYADLLLVVCEANAWPYGAGASSQRTPAGEHVSQRIEHGDIATQRSIREENLVRARGREPERVRPVRESGRGRPADELVHLVALRPATGERFDRIAAPTAGLAPSTSFHCGIPDGRLLAGEPHADVIAAFARFARPTDIIAAWGFYSPDLLRASGAAIGELLDIRGAAQRLLHRRLGSLEAFAATLGPASTHAYRAERRLAALAQIITTWRDL